MLSDTLKQSAIKACVEREKAAQSAIDTEREKFFASGWDVTLKAILEMHAQRGDFSAKIQAPNSCFEKLQLWAKNHGLHCYQVYDNELWVCW